MSEYNLSNLSIDIFIVKQLKLYRVQLQMEEHNNINLAKDIFLLPKDAMYDRIRNDLDQSNRMIEYLHMMIHCFTRLDKEQFDPKRL